MAEKKMIKVTLNRSTAGRLKSHQACVADVVEFAGGADRRHAAGGRGMVPPRNQDREGF